MEKKIIFWVISLSVVAVALAVLLPGGRKVDSDPKLPWDIQITANNEIQVFDLTLNKSQLPEAREIFQNQGKVNLFIGADGHPALEAYFERVFLSGLRADFILALKADESLLNQLVERGSRISRTSDTTHKIVLGSDDLQIAEQLPIELINYIPAANLDEKLINSRFGEPADKIVETETGVTHWIYPDRGMTIGLNPEGKELIQYMPLERIQGLVEQIKSSNAQYEEKMKNS
ncbi:MAG: hypothetical protein N0C81_02180 [Candidatus Thiodiazotropha lotti]|uniref:Uncharacterized protein n=1 Tax=Candidatus Thiodiazotropha lotti TaxID=2792787 RepID=A0A9E4K6N0_9GAMM|nr:hypothetical protein [Candidatus Thiodiazotropha lotti]ODC01719.1 hypothetical protein A3197_04460 [Candidatus Thiodiazotropha endoloripes]MCG7921296.1 hypothetical protein [Candidatus Thiodiazotropha lotti]MCG7930263.1 hypothetical protein [Candidatus Thiodiazotropha lotti]MCG7939806.1 hypothetical protein [Candidatus Thiodiazotropha lotti]